MCVNVPWQDLMGPSAADGSPPGHVLTALSWTVQHHNSAVPRLLDYHFVIQADQVDNLTPQSLVYRICIGYESDLFSKLSSCTFSNFYSYLLSAGNVTDDHYVCKYQEPS